MGEPVSLVCVKRSRSLGGFSCAAVFADLPGFRSMSSLVLLKFRRSFCSWRSRCRSCVLSGKRLRFADLHRQRLHHGSAFTASFLLRKRPSCLLAERCVGYLGYAFRRWSCRGRPLGGAPLYSGRRTIAPLLIHVQSAVKFLAEIRNLI